MVWTVGETLQNGRYLIEAILQVESRGFVITYKALDIILSQQVIIETTNDQLKYHKDYTSEVELFIKESRSLVEFYEKTHPHIERAVNIFKEGETTCLVMNFIPENSLWELVRRRGKIAESEALKYIYQIGSALSIMHKNSQCHQHINPGNIIIRTDGTAVLLNDLTINKKTGLNSEPPDFDPFPFKAYEQLRQGNIDQPTEDIYSLAATLYYALSGRYPVASSYRKIFNHKLLPPKQLVVTISDRINQAILKGMAVEAKDRPQSIDQWIDLLGMIVNPNDLILKPIIWQPGQKLYGGRYTIERELGSGGFGITYLARDNQGNQVVIKTLNKKTQTRTEAKIKQDFANEATRLGYCVHPHIVRIENKFDEENLPCIVMEYIKGENLFNRVDNCGALSEQEALIYIQQIGDALSFIHGRGLLHRDVKPDNIIVRSGQSEAVLIDFGIAKEFIPDVTQRYTQVCTHGFSPIEQYDQQGKLGDYTDVYALAATLYYLLTGKVPSPAFNRGIRDELIPPKQHNSNISDTVNQAILRGLALDAKKRPQSVREWMSLCEGLESTNLPTKTSLFGNMRHRLAHQIPTVINLILIFIVPTMLTAIVSILDIKKYILESEEILNPKNIVSKSAIFYCELQNEPKQKYGVWTVMYYSIKGKKPWLKIVSNLAIDDMAIDNGCSIIAERMNVNSRYGITEINYLRSSGAITEKETKEYIICVKTQASGKTCLPIVRLKSVSNPNQKLREIIDALSVGSSAAEI